MKRKSKAWVAWSLHINPDGSRGGFIAPGGSAEIGAIVEDGAYVLPGGSIKSGERLNAGEWLDKAGPMKPVICPS